MNGWLVTFATSIDDIPVKGFLTATEAIQFIKDNPPHDPRDREKGDQACDEVTHALDVAGRDTARVMGYQLWHFENGVPITVKPYFWDENEGEAELWPDDDGPSDTWRRKQKS